MLLKQILTPEAEQDSRAYMKLPLGAAIRFIAPTSDKKYFTLEAFSQFRFSRQLYLLNVFTFQSSSTINPLIYGLIKTEFKEDYKKVLYCRD